LSRKTWAVGNWFSGGWFNKEINSVEDLKGVKFRTTSFASEMATEFGIAANDMSGPAMFQAL